MATHYPGNLLPKKVKELGRALENRALSWRIEGRLPSWSVAVTGIHLPVWAMRAPHPRSHTAMEAT